MEFCKAFNAKTQQMEKGMPIPVIITAYQDRTFTFEIKQPPASHWIKKAAKIDKGSKKPGTDFVGKIKKSQLAEIAKSKMIDMNANDVDHAVTQLAGSARSMGIEVVEG